MVEILEYFTRPFSYLLLVVIHLNKHSFMKSNVHCILRRWWNKLCEQKTRMVKDTSEEKRKRKARGREKYDEKCNTSRWGRQRGQMLPWRGFLPLAAGCRLLPAPPGRWTAARGRSRRRGGGWQRGWRVGEKGQQALTCADGAGAAVQRLGESELDKNINEDDRQSEEDGNEGSSASSQCRGEICICDMRWWKWK